MKRAAVHGFDGYNAMERPWRARAVLGLINSGSQRHAVAHNGFQRSHSNTDRFSNAKWHGAHLVGGVVDTMAFLDGFPEDSRKEEASQKQLRQPNHL